MKTKVKIELFVNVDRSLWKNSDLIALFSRAVSSINSNSIKDQYKLELEKITDKNITEV